ncbi:MAG: hypothetical protein KTR30_24190 [Saprospiraceae bacterium]|nr:hypothetical protein [Saprospiraceae bacterium]
MKNLLSYIILGVAGVFLLACEKAYEAPMEENNHVSIVTSQMDFANTIQVEGELTFGDVSRGVVSRTWTFPEGVVDIMDSDNDVTSAEEIVKAVFNKPGEYPIQLNLQFAGNAWVGNQQGGNTFDTTILVKVLDFVKIAIQANYINEDGSTGDPLSVADLAKNEVTASKSVRFTYTAEGEPADFLWEFEGGDPGVIKTAESEIDIKYKRMGTYGLRFIASRNRPNGGDTLEFKDFISVVPSTDPVNLEQITEKDGAIALVFSREMDPTTLNAGDFAVTIENKEAVINPSLAEVSIDANEGNIVLLALAGETLYNDDQVKVSYTPGQLSTLDGVAATAFAEQTLAFNKVNILEEQSDFDFSFENSTADNWPYLWWGGIWGEYDLEISSDQAMDGNQSAYIEFRPNGGMIIGHRDLSGNPFTFPVEAGKVYELGVWVYVDDIGANDPAGFDPDLRFYWDPGTDWSVGGNPTFTTDFKIGEWVYTSSYVQFGESGDKNFWIRGFNENNPETFKFYMDNLSLAEVVLRP